MQTLLLLRFSLSNGAYILFILCGAKLYLLSASSSIHLSPALSCLQIGVHFAP